MPVTVIFFVMSYQQTPIISSLQLLSPVFTVHLGPIKQSFFFHLLSSVLAISHTISFLLLKHIYDLTYLCSLIQAGVFLSLRAMIFNLGGNFPLGVLWTLKKAVSFLKHYGESTILLIFNVHKTYYYFAYIFKFLNLDS